MEYITNATLGINSTGVIFLVCVFYLLLSLENGRRKSPKLSLKASIPIPSPPKLPLIGHLHLLNGNPFEEMTKIGKKYGEIYALQLGTVEAVVVSSYRLIKQVLVEKGGDFGDRIGFKRYHVLFGDDKENSLAFCNWSQVQKTRRALARRFCHTSMYAAHADLSLDKASIWLSSQILNTFSSQPTLKSQKQLKETLHKACANAFFGFFCTDMFEDPEDKEFTNIVRTFDDIFYEINQGHPTDVLPFLSPFFKKHLNNLAGMGTTIRKFVVERIIEPHLETLDKDNPRDFVDILLSHLQDADPENRLTLEQVLYELEDFLGGHSAVANLLVRTLIEIAAVPGLSQKIYENCIERKNDAYWQAIIYETLRVTSSPIVPHVASVDSTIDGYEVKKGTMIMLNNFDLNTDPLLWTNPEMFYPERFLNESGHFRKPAHFLPFSSGKRACMGYKLVEKITQGLLTAIIKDFNIVQLDNPNILPKSCVAVHPEIDLRFTFVPRESTFIQ